VIYLDNAATTLQKPPEVYEAVAAALRTCASIGRSAHKPARHAAELAFACRTEAADLFDAEAEQVVFTMNATHGLNIAIRSVVREGDRVVVSGFEHNAVLRPLHALHARIVTAGTRLFDPADTLEAFERAVTPETRAVVCTHVSNVFGYALPMEEIATLCRSRQVPLIVDAAQSAGILPVSLNRWQAAFIAMPGHKALYGPQGTGLLLCSRIGEPLLLGGTGSMSQSPEMPDFLPDRLEAGTMNTPGIAGLLAGLRFVRKTGIEDIRRREAALLNRLKTAMGSISEVLCYSGDDTMQSGVLSFQVPGKDCEVLAQQLADAEIAVRAGLHCAPAAHRSAGTMEQGTVRVSLSLFQTEQELDHFVSVLQEILRP